MSQEPTVTALQHGSGTCAVLQPKAGAGRVYWLQAVTVAWMLVELGVAGFAAVSARSPVMLAFGSDSLVELLSAAVVISQWAPRMAVSEHKAGRIAGWLLFVLAAIVAATAILTLLLKVSPERSLAGIGITLAALVMMPVLAMLKRREARRLGNRALAADAVQSATCAYLAAIALAGVAVNAIFGIAWFDSIAALCAVPILLEEGRAAWRDESCGCCGV